jgi:hypothetical protein
MYVHFLERAKETREGVAEIGRDAPGLPKVAVTELVGAGDDGSSHRPVLVSPSGPGLGVVHIDPQSEAHIDYYGPHENRVVSPLTYRIGGADVGFRNVSNQGGAHISEEETWACSMYRVS